jgi:hypothetical protein
VKVFADGAEAALDAGVDVEDVTAALVLVDAIGLDGGGKYRAPV